MEERHFRNATDWTKDAKIHFARPRLWRIWSEFLGGWEPRHAIYEARGHEQAGIWIPGHELSGVDIVKGIRRYNMLDDTNGIERCDIIRPEQRRW
jgi:hypothetical protein